MDVEIVLVVGLAGLVLGLGALWLLSGWTGGEDEHEDNGGRRDRTNS
jgi:hypothetical protein